MPSTVFKAVKYIRLSQADDKPRDSNSVVTQRKLLDCFIESQPDIEAVSERVDDGVSGMIFDRPSFNAMMSDIESGKVNCVIVRDLSRLGREYIETGRYLRQVFPSYGVRFIALDDNIDTLWDSSDDLFLSIKSILNDAYSHDISIKTRISLNNKRDHGAYVGACPIYGYQKSKSNHNQLIIDESSAGIVRDIFRMKIDGMSASKIAEKLNHLGILSPLEYKKAHNLPHPTGGYSDRPDTKWSAHTIIRILKDETYTGTLVQGRQGTVNYKLKDIINKPQSEWKRTEHAHEAIVPKHTFETVQRIMRLDTRTSPYAESVHTFSGIIICGCCGAQMTRKTTPFKDKRYHNYWCSTGKAHGCKDAVFLKESYLHEYVLGEVKSHITEVVSQKSLEPERNDTVNVIAEQYMVQIRESRRKLDEINVYKAALYEKMIDELLTKKEYKELKTEYVAEEARLVNMITALESKLEDSTLSEQVRWAEYLKCLDSLDRRTVVTLIHSIRIVSKTDLRIAFNDQPENVFTLLQDR